MRALDGSRLKVVRAEEHLNSFKTEIRSYLDTQPYEVVREQGNNTWTVVVRLKEKPPIRLGTIFGDCLNNLRAALDYIAWQLASRYSPKQLIVGHDRPSFPIYIDAKKYSAQGLSKYGVPAQAVDEIERVQPYHTGYELLGLLHALVNEDKHRLPLLTLAHASANELEIRTPQGRIIGSGGLTTLTTPAFSLTAEDATSGDDVEVNAQVTVFVTLQNVAMPRAPIDRTLELIVKCVADVIPRFEPFLA
jgi:hypothetical protein